MKPFAEKLTEDRRLVLLRLLSEQNGQTANSSVLTMGLNHLGIVVERHQVVDDLRHLQLHGLIQLEQVIETVYVARLLGRGEDVVSGLLTVAGVSRARRGL